jgi:hypothetical protein
MCDLAEQSALRIHDHVGALRVCAPVPAGEPQLSRDGRGRRKAPRPSPTSFNITALSNRMGRLTAVRCPSVVGHEVKIETVPQRVARSAFQLDETGVNGSSFRAQTGQFRQDERG